MGPHAKSPSAPVPHSLLAARAAINTESIIYRICLSDQLDLGKVVYISPGARVKPVLGDYEKPGHTQPHSPARDQAR